MKKLKRLLSFVLVFVLAFSQLPVMIQAVADKECVIVSADGLVETEYMTFGEAMDAVNHGETIRLLGNVDYVKNGSLPAITIKNKTITFDVGEFTLNVSNNQGDALKVGSGGEVLLEYQEDGEFNVSVGGNYGRGVYAEDGGTATVTNVSASSGGTIGVSAESSDEYGPSVVKVLGNVTATDDAQIGVAVSKGGEIEICGDVITHDVVSSIQSFYGTVTVNNITATGSCAVGASADAGGEITVLGNISITTENWAIGTQSDELAKLRVMGDITVKSGRADAEGVKASSGSEVNVLGSVHVESTNDKAIGIITYGDEDPYDYDKITAGGRVMVGGDVTVVSPLDDEDASVGVYTEAYASESDSGGVVTVEGRITAQRYAKYKISDGETSSFDKEHGVAGTDDYEGYWIYRDSLSELRVRGLLINTPSLPDATWGTAYSMPPLSTLYRPITTSGDALIFNASGLPDGLSIDSEGGVISGIPGVSAFSKTPFSVTVTVTDGKVRATKIMPLTVKFDPGTTLNVTFNSVGKAHAQLSVDAGESIGNGWPQEPVRTGYAFGGWYTGENGTGTEFTNATLILSNITLYAKWTQQVDDNDDDDNDDGNDDDHQTQPSTPQAPGSSAQLKTGNGNELTLPILVDTKSGHTSVDMSASGFPEGHTVLTMPSLSGINSFAVDMKFSQLQQAHGQQTLTLSTDIGDITLPSNMLTGMEGITGNKTRITLGLGDKSRLPDDVKEAIGDRPLIQLTLFVDGRQTDWNNPDASVTVSIPYTPTAEERENHDSIVIWYIDGSGKVVTIPNGRYDPESGRVIFETNHFSDYGIAYHPVSFNDIVPNAWYEKAVSFIAARGITAGTGNGSFSPDSSITRGEFIVMLLRAYGIAPDEMPLDNFVDGGDSYYTGYLASAKRLGISAGIGNNRFGPDRVITRQEMLTLMYNALKVLNKLPSEHSGRTLSDFSDASEIAPWAEEAMKLMVESGITIGTGAKLNPIGTSTRAEMAQILYRLLSR